MPKVARDLVNVEIMRLEKPGFHTVSHWRQTVRRGHIAP